MRIAASQFVSTAPSDTFLALKISGGNIAIVPSGPLTSGPVIEVGTRFVQAEFQVDSTSSANSEAGFLFQAPSSITVRLGPSGATISNVVDPSPQIFGITIPLTFINRPATISSQSRLSFAFSVQQRSSHHPTLA